MNYAPLRNPVLTVLLEVVEVEVLVAQDPWAYVLWSVAPNRLGGGPVHRALHLAWVYSIQTARDAHQE